MRKRMLQWGMQPKQLLAELKSTLRVREFLGIMVRALNALSQLDVLSHIYDVLQYSFYEHVLQNTKYKIQNTDVRVWCGKISPLSMRNFLLKLVFIYWNFMDVLMNVCLIWWHAKLFCVKQFILIYRSLFNIQGLVSHITLHFWWTNTVRNYVKYLTCGSITKRAWQLRWMS